MSLWGRVFAATYDKLIFERSEKAGLTEMRRGVVGQASGRVLELGAGTGLNVALYPREGIDELVFSEPEEPMARRLEDRVADSGRSAQVVRAGAEALPFADDSFDTVIATLVLCTVPSVEDSLAEVKRVMAPGGRLLFMEHVRHPDAKRARTQQRLTPVWKHVACGCHLDRDTPQMIEDAGFSMTSLQRSYFPKGPPFVQPVMIGVATPA